MAKDDNKNLILARLWDNPGVVFGCAFKPQGQYQANVKSEKYPETGRIRLKRQPSGGITLYYNKTDKEGVNGLDVLTWLERNELYTSGFNDTLQALARIYGIDLKYTAEETQRMNRKALAREIAPLLIDQLKNNPDGKTARYLRDVRQIDNDGVHFGELTEQGIKDAQAELKRRGYKYDVEDIKALGLTYEHAKAGFNLAIPYYTNGVVTGFVLRNINPGVESKDRYRDSRDLRKGYCDRLAIGGRAVVVEGELKAIKLIQAGVTNVVAMSGAIIGENITKLLKAHNITQAVYVPDLELNADKERKPENVKLVHDAIKALQGANVDGQNVLKAIYVADLPTPRDLEPFRTPKGDYKIDADEFGKVFGPDELANAVNAGVSCWLYECTELLAWAGNESKANGGVNVVEFQNRFEDIYNRNGNEFERQRIKNYIKTIPTFADCGITPGALSNKDEWNKGRLYNESVKALSQELAEAVKDQANPVRVNSILRRFNDLQGLDARAEWNDQLNQTFEDELQAIQDQPNTLVTKWELGNITKTGEYKRYCNIEYWPADIEVFCAPTSHGKTMILFQSALDLIQSTGKTFLYVSCEENKRQLTERALNVYIDIQNTEKGKTPNGEYCFIAGTRKKTIKAILRKAPGVYDYAPEHYNDLYKRVWDKVNQYGQSIRPYLKMVHTEGTTESICANVLYYIEQLNDNGAQVGGVFVDYMQLLTTDGKNFSRHDELKDICKGLKTLASQTELPVIIGAQLNREVMRKEQGIDNITVANIGEGADIERIAHDVYLLWQVDKTPIQQYTTVTDKKGEITSKVNPTGLRSMRLFTTNKLHPDERELKTGYMYVEQLKARDGKTDGWGLFAFDGERGFIGNNDTEKMKE